MFERYQISILETESRFVLLFVSQTLDCLYIVWLLSTPTLPYTFVIIKLALCWFFNRPHCLKDHCGSEVSILYIFLRSETLNIKQINILFFHKYHLSYNTSNSPFIFLNFRISVSFVFSLWYLKVACKTTDFII